MPIDRLIKRPTAFADGLRTGEAGELTFPDPLINTWFLQAQGTETLINYDLFGSANTWTDTQTFDGAADFDGAVTFDDTVDFNALVSFNFQVQQVGFTQFSFLSGSTLACLSGSFHTHQGGSTTSFASGSNLTFNFGSIVKFLGNTDFDSGANLNMNAGSDSIWDVSAAFLCHSKPQFNNGIRIAFGDVLNGGLTGWQLIDAGWDGAPGDGDHRVGNRIENKGSIWLCTDATQENKTCRIGTAKAGQGYLAEVDCLSVNSVRTTTANNRRVLTGGHETAGSLPGTPNTGRTFVMNSFCYTGEDDETDYSASASVGQGGMSGGRFALRHKGDGDILLAVGISAFVEIRNTNAAGTITESIGVSAESGRSGNGTGTITDYRAFKAYAPREHAGAPIQTAHGLFVEFMDAGFDTYGIEIGGGGICSLWCGSESGITALETQILFGFDKDTNLYRGTADQLKTDDQFRCDSLIVDVDAQIVGTLNHDGASVGLFGTLPVTQPVMMTGRDTICTITAPTPADPAIVATEETGGGIWGFASEDQMQTFVKAVINLQIRSQENEDGLDDAGTGIGVFSSI